MNLFKRIYDKSKYEVSEAVKNGDEYTCKVVIYPIDIFEQLLDALTIGYAPYDDFNTKWEAKFSEIAAKDMTDEELTAAYESLYVDYNTEYADVIIGLAESLLPQLDYKEGKSISVQVQKGTDGFYRINDDDWKNIDGSMIYYP